VRLSDGYDAGVIAVGELVTVAPKLMARLMELDSHPRQTPGEHPLMSNAT
jgi:hypothetical protein